MQSPLTKIEEQTAGLYLGWQTGPPAELFSWQRLRDLSLGKVTCNPKVSSAKKHL